MPVPLEGNDKAKEAMLKMEETSPLLKVAKGEDELPPFSRNNLALDTLQFITALVWQLGPITAIYCHSSEYGLGMSLSRTGIVMATITAFSVISGPPFGMLLDWTEKKKLVLCVGFGITAFTYFLLAQKGVNTFGAVLFVLIAQSTTAGMYQPGINSLSLGIVGASGFTKRATRNEITRHAGVLLQGLLPIAMIHSVGFQSYFILLMFLAMGGVASVLLIDWSTFDHTRARGSKMVLGSTKEGEATPYLTLFRNVSILLVLGAVTLFHCGNAAMLPMVGQKIDDLSHRNSTHMEIPYVGSVDGTIGVSIAMVISEITCIPVSYYTGKFAERPGWGRRRVALLGFLALPIRGILFAMINSIGGLLFFQVLDGVSGAVCGVVAILMMQDLTDGTGRFSTMQGAVTAALGAGSATSQILAGFVADESGYAAMFITLATIGSLSWACIAIIRETKVSLVQESDIRCYFL
eukprot:m.9224 g.9224  ORF g.9224 m.9224 type:complete len:465 (-) comp4026_c0_seq1:66-1460(-)